MFRKCRNSSTFWSNHLWHHRSLCTFLQCGGNNNHITNYRTLPANFTQNKIRMWDKICKNHSAYWELIRGHNPWYVGRQLWLVLQQTLSFLNRCFWKGAFQPLSCCPCPLVSGFTGTKCGRCLMYALSSFLLDNLLILADCFFHAK